MNDDIPEILRPAWMAPKRSMKEKLKTTTNSATTGYMLFNMHALGASTRELGATTLGELLTDKSAELREKG